MVIARSNDLDIVSSLKPLSRFRPAISVRQLQGAPLELPRENFDDAPAFGALLQMFAFPSFYLEVLSFALGT